MEHFFPENNQVTIRYTNIFIAYKFLNIIVLSQKILLVLPLNMNVSLKYVTWQFINICILHCTLYRSTKNCSYSKLWLKLTYVKGHSVRILIIARFVLFGRTYRVLRRLGIICGNFFRLKKFVAEAHQMLVEAHGEASLSEINYCQWFHRFKSGKFDIN